MEYKELSKLYHMNTGSSRDRDLQTELEKRLRANSTFLLDFNTPNGNLFIAVPRELSVLSERVLKNEQHISDLLRELPEIAKKAILRSMVLDEVVSTNKIEDIHSTRRQIKDALDAAPGTKSSLMRFKELSTLYLAILDNSEGVPKTVEDVRSIYDRVTAGEIAGGKLPDGRLFRKEGVDIIASGSRIVHCGIEPEQKIIEAIRSMLALLQNEDFPFLYRAIASHYIFEYIHPFYDGNGRTGRYLLSLSLRKSLSAATALSLSRVILEHREVYYHAFKTAENKLNHAELTFFVYTMLDLIEEAQFDIIDELENNLDTLNRLREKMSEPSIKADIRGKERDIVFLLLQYEAFGLFGDATLQEIANYLNLGEQQTRKHLANLEKRGICEKVRAYNPLTFKLTEVFKNVTDVLPKQNTCASAQNRL